MHVAINDSCDANNHSCVGMFLLMSWCLFDAMKSAVDHCISGVHEDTRPHGAYTTTWDGCIYAKCWCVFGDDYGFIKTIVELSLLSFHRKCLVNFLSKQNTFTQ